MVHKIGQAVRFEETEEKQLVFCHEVTKHQARQQVKRTAALVN